MKLIEAGKDPPEVYYTQPVISEFDMFYWNAFHELSTERQIGMGLGPIPRSAIMSYADECGMSTDTTEQFAFIIRELDVEYLQAINAPQKDRGKEKLFEVPISDVQGTKQLLSRLSARAKTAKGRPSSNGKP